MNKSLRPGFAVIAFLFIGLVAAAVIFLYTADFNRYRGLIEQAVTDATGRQLTIKGDLTIALSLRPELVVYDVALANASWGSQPQMVHIGQLRVRINIIPLLKGDLDIARIRMIDTDLLLETDTGGQVNWQFAPETGSSTGPGMPKLAVRQLLIEQFAVTLRNGETGSPATHYRLNSFTLKRAVGADLADVVLNGSSNGQAVVLSGQIGLLKDLFAGARFPVDLSGEIAGATVKLHGEISNVMTLEGFDLSIQASGSNLATLGTGLELQIPQTDKFDMMAHLTGSGERLSLQDARGSASYKGTQLAVTGGIAGLNALEGIGFQLRGSGSDLAELRSIFTETLPQTGAFEVSAKLTGNSDVLALMDAQGTISQRSVKATLSGGIANLITLEGIDLQLKGAGNDLAELRSIFTETLPQTGAF
ncbi:MAG: AsmA family protein, partial [Gammaproteobacteria bacterium]|nr:AsmA family protein [Gammaproteobacteria bacterium]